MSLNGHDIFVCKTAFCGLHGIKKGRVNRLANHKLTCDTPPLDKRGISMGSRIRKKGDEEINKIKEHIKRFPTRKSHYSRNKTLKKYLSPELTVKKMHSLFLQEQEPEVFEKLKNNEKVKPNITYEFYNKIFCTNFNYSFGKPRSDTCSMCDLLKIKIEAEVDAIKKSELKTEHNVHLQKANLFYNNLKEIGILCKNDNGIEGICFDFQQNMPVPVLPVGDIFYSRQIWVFNQCFYSLTTEKSSMYMYDEMTAKKGANETISFLKHYIDTKIPPDVKLLYLFSDNCAGQNKNFVLVRFLSLLAASGRFEKIIHCFPERGHSFLPCDRCFGQIEIQKRKKEYLFIPEEWLSMVSNTSKKFEVVRVTQDMVKDYKTALETYFKKVIKNNVETFKISKYKRFVYVGKDITVSENQNSFVTQTYVAFKKGIDPKTLLTLLTLRKLYSEEIPLNPKKLENINSLRKYIPFVYQEWYDRLQSGTNTITEESAESSVSESDDED